MKITYPIRNFAIFVDLNMIWLLVSYILIDELEALVGNCIFFILHINAL